MGRCRTDQIPRESRTLKARGLSSPGAAFVEENIKDHRTINLDRSRQAEPADLKQETLERRKRASDPGMVPPADARGCGAGSAGHSRFHKSVGALRAYGLRLFMAGFNQAIALRNAAKDSDTRR